MNKAVWNVVGIIMGTILILMALSGAVLIFPTGWAYFFGGGSVVLNSIELYLKRFVRKEI